jgi:hypothetical protein
VIFFKTRSPVEPVAFVEKICRDVAGGAPLGRCRFVKRLTPMTAFDKATPKGLEAVAKLVLAPHFHVPDQEGKKARASRILFLLHQCLICHTPVLERYAKTALIVVRDPAFHTEQ